MWIPLNDEMSSKFNETASRQFFYDTNGLPYGYHNILFGWMDTPDMNNPPLLAPTFVPVLWNLVSMVDSDVSDMMFGKAINFHLGTTGLSIPQLAARASEEGKSLEDLIAVVEQDGWEYTGEHPRDGLSYVCSSYVTAHYKAAGLFGDNEINAVEFTPKDLYQLAFFKSDWDRPAQCVEADPDTPYCQLSGKYRRTLPGLNSIAAYPHMNEKCPSVAPEYVRPDGC